jgi:hypothetical protein
MGALAALAIFVFFHAIDDTVAVVERNTEDAMLGTLSRWVKPNPCGGPVEKCDGCGKVRRREKAANRRFR